MSEKALAPTAEPFVHWLAIAVPVVVFSMMIRREIYNPENISTAGGVSSIATQWTA